MKTDPLTATRLSRRQALTGAIAGASALLLPARAIAATDVSRTIPKPLFARALAALGTHGDLQRDVMAIADFSAASSTPRFHLVNLENGRTTSLLVAHGRGSDPAHSGYVQRFSNQPGSNASSSGAYRTESLYVGQHGRSRRLAGLDPTNSNAEPRAIVVHAAWYVSPDMVRDHGKLGRSEGCFAVADNTLEQVLGQLGQGRMIYADKV